MAMENEAQIVRAVVQCWRLSAWCLCGRACLLEMLWPRLLRFDLICDGVMQCLIPLRNMHDARFLQRGNTRVVCCLLAWVSACWHVCTHTDTSGEGLQS